MSEADAHDCTALAGLVANVGEPRRVAGILAAIGKSPMHPRPAISERPRREQWRSTLEGPADEATGVLAIPLRRAQQAADLAALPVDEQRRRQAGDAQGAAHARARIGVEGELCHLGLVEELARAPAARAVDAQCHHLKRL